MQSITVTALQQKINAGENFQLIDVREPDEHEEFNIGGQLIPLGEIAQQVEKIATDQSL
jgi:rhodanese-related sulfurtransferase